MRILVLALAFCCCCLPALAAPDTGGLADADFTARSFGTVARLHTPVQVVDPNVGWWAEKLPAQINENPGYVIGLFNARRMDNGTPLLDPSEYLIIPLGENIEGNEYFYDIEFVGIRPSEVEALVEMLGGPGKLLPGCERVSYVPLRHRAFNIYGDAEAVMQLTIGDHPVTIAKGTSLDQAYAQLQSAFRSAFGQDVTFELTMMDSVYLDGTRNRNISVYADMDYDASMNEAAMEANEEYDG